jgi:hypothetical protein
MLSKTIWKLGRVARWTLAWLVLASIVFAQDVRKTATTNYVQFLNVPWGNGAGAFNNNFWFNTLQTEQGVCVWISNNNTTNSHSFSLVVSSTANPAIGGFTGFTSQWTSTANAAGTSFPFTLSPASTTTFFYTARSSAFIALSFSGSAAAGGSPDTANIIAVLTSAANCTAIVIGNTVIGPTPDGSTIASANNQPLIVGGKQAIAGVAYLQTATTSYIDANTHGWLVGTTVDANETSQPRGTAINIGASINGPPAFLHVEPWGQQTDIPMGGGGGDQQSPLRNSRAYGTATSDIWQWGSTNAAGVGAPLLTFNSRTDQVNPAAGTLLLGINVNNVVNNGISPYRVTVSCSAACDFFINATSNAGTTCAAGTIVRSFDDAVGAVGNYAAITGGCVANPTTTKVLFHIWLAAGGTWQQNMVGYWIRKVATVGLGYDVVSGGAVAAGTMSTMFEFMERSGDI